MRLGRDVPKALVEVGGTPMIAVAARQLLASGVVDALVVTAPPGHGDDMRRALGTVSVPCEVVDGGTTRQASVAAGLATADGGTDVVLVHDAARPLTPPALVARVVAAVRGGFPAVVPGLPVTDTVKQVAREADEAAAPRVERVVSTPDRAALRAVQTPQGFDRALLQRAHTEGAARAATEHLAATDDAGLVEALGETVHMVAGDAAAMKITTAHDLAVAEMLLEAR
ncbi:2-C-methyl-D-erythritol 4-phosphate cytidylyltransferase [Isoptericola chiayiensis]|uniref:2-C-methyl-D-erythritol 4-phosphate cytidylyltransferase n=1 Tax=Isoptericola chiayiensis TaxID=579446 RepID=A0ABP8Y035_9MICO